MDTPQARGFGEVLRRHRVAAGLTQEALAEQAHLSTRAISALEQGVNRTPRNDTVTLLADALALSGVERAAFHAAARRPPLAPAPGAPGAGAGAASPLIGREHELALLARHLAGDGPPVLLLCGEPGIGKSRLLREAMGRAAALDWSVLHGGCQRRGGMDPYAPLVNALARHLREQTPAQQRVGLRGCAWLVRLLPELASAPIEPLPGWTVSPEQERRLMFAGVARYLANVAGPAGTVLLLDDLQWAGADALDLLLVLVAEQAAARPLRVIGTYRDAEVLPDDPLSVTLAALADAALVRRRGLRPMNEDEARRLLDGLLDDDDPTGEARAEVLARTGGVPFFLVSWVQSLRSGEGNAGPAAIPWTVTQSVRQRVVALPPAAREVLAAAAVVGRVAPRALLMSIVALAPAEVAAALETACRAALLEEDGPASYRFTHDLIREVVEADSGAARRVLLHHAIARVLREQPGDPPVEAIAYHYAHAEEHGPASEWLERAGDQAAATFANATALQHYAAAHDHVLAGGGDAEALSRLEEKSGDLHGRRAEYAQALEHLARAHRHAAGAARRAELRCKEGVFWTRRGAYAQALAAFDAAVAGGAGDLSRAALAAVEVGRAETYYHQDEYEHTEAAARRAVRLLEEETPGDAGALVVAAAHHYLGMVVTQRGDLGRAEAYLRESLAVRLRLSRQEDIAWSWSTLGCVLSYQGDLARSGDCMARSLAIMEGIDDHGGIATTTVLSGRLLLRQGLLQPAEEHLRRGVSLTTTLEKQGQLGWTSTSLAEVLLARGDLRGADVYARRGLDLARRGSDRSTIATSYLILGDLACARGEVATAFQSYSAARRLFRRLRIVPEQASVLLGQARALLDAGRLRRAALVLAHVHALVHAHGLGMSGATALLLEAELSLCQGRVGEARAAAAEAGRLARAQQLRREAALAQRLLGRCALARGDVEEAIACLRDALAGQAAMGADLEAARTRLLLAGALALEGDNPAARDEARLLLAEAGEQFAASGAAIDLARAQRLAATWPAR